LLPVNEVDEVVVIKPEECTQCHAPLSGDDPKPWRHQVIELPPIKPVVTEYQWHQLVCAACGEVTRAPWPTGVPSGTYGPRVQATVALYPGSYRVSKRTTQQMMDEVFGVPVSVGTISQLEQATTEAVAAPVEEARTFVHEQEVAHLDETSWRQGGKRAWLWVAVTSVVTVFVVRLSRGAHVARELLGEEFSGILVTDRYSAYNWYPVRWRQVCWAHLLRDFADSPGFSGGVYPNLSKAPRSEDLEIEQPVACRDCASFDFHPTLASVLGATLIGHKVVQMCEPSQKGLLVAFGMMKRFHHEQFPVDGVMGLIQQGAGHRHSGVFEHRVPARFLVLEPLSHALAIGCSSHGSDVLRKAT
jgi:hypothetical protein